MGNGEGKPTEPQGYIGIRNDKNEGKPHFKMHFKYEYLPEDTPHDVKFPEKAEDHLYVEIAGTERFNKPLPREIETDQCTYKLKPGKPGELCVTLAKKDKSETWPY